MLTLLAVTEPRQGSLKIEWPIPLWYRITSFEYEFDYWSTGAEVGSHLEIGCERSSGALIAVTLLALTGYESACKCSARSFEVGRPVFDTKGFVGGLRKELGPLVVSINDDILS